MHVYNAILVLKEIIDVFPLANVNEVVGSSIDLEIQKLVQTEERGDLKIIARAYVVSVPAFGLLLRSLQVLIELEEARKVLGYAEGKSTGQGP